MHTSPSALKRYAQLSMIFNRTHVHYISEILCHPKIKREVERYITLMSFFADIKNRYMNIKREDE